MTGSDVLAASWRAFPSPWLSLLVVLAAYRTTRLLTFDLLPGPLRRLRAGLLERYPALAEMWKCVGCIGLWVAAAWYLFWLFAPGAVPYAAAPLALSALIIIVFRNLE